MKKWNLIQGKQIVVHKNVQKRKEMYQFSIIKRHTFFGIYKWEDMKRLLFCSYSSFCISVYNHIF